MSSLRKQKRIRETAKEFEEQVNNLVAIENLSSKPDDELFVLDKVGSKSKRQKLSTGVVIGGISSSYSCMSKSELNLIKRAISKKKKQSEESEFIPVTNLDVDLWADESSVVTPTTGLRNVKKMKLKVRKDQLIHPGQSYNPSIMDHQDAIAEAVALQIKRNESDSLRISSDHSSNAKVSIAPLNDEEDEEDGDVEDDDEEGTGFRKKKMKVKLTRAQRNKIRVRKEKQSQFQKEQQEKSILKSIDSLPGILSSLQQRDVKINLERKIRQTRQTLKTQQQAVVPYMDYDEVAAVPLSDELTGSVRTLRPKGVALRDSLMMMKTQGVVGQSSSDKRLKRKKHEKPHAEKNIKWHSKYKL